MTVASVIWDNFTNGNDTPEYQYDKRYSLFIVGISFASGLVGGMVLHWVYSCAVCCLVWSIGEDAVDTSRGMVNVSFVGDDQQPPADDSPPDYDSVVQSQPGGKKRNLLNKLLWWRSAQNTHEHLEEDPPSFESAMANMASSDSERY